MGKKFKNVLIFIVVVALIIGVVAGAVALSKKGTPSQPNDSTDTGGIRIAAISDNGEKMYAGGTYAMPDQLTIVAQAPKAGEYSSAGEFVLSVSAPGAPINSKYNFTLSFMDVKDLGWDYLSSDYNPLNSKSTDPSDYINITPLSSNTVKVNYLCKFPLPIEIKAQALGSSDYATCRVDCAVLFQPPMHVYFGEATGKQIPYYLEQKSDFDILPLDFDDTGKIGLYINYYRPNGTVASGAVIRDCTLKLTSEFIARLKSYLRFDISIKDYNSKASVESNHYRDFGDDGSSKIDAYEFECGKLDYSMFIENFNSFSKQQKQSVYYAWYAAFTNSGEASNLEIQLNRVQITYSGVVLYDYDSSVISNFRTNIRFAAISGKRYGENLILEEVGV
ncbi:MAG: hypothetical protein J1F61_00790 [Clostridiales bacterium]|nr:hypothetical protein [Clostridiales bacterium]